MVNGDFLVGPTAVGKTAVAHWIAVQDGRTVVSADSMLIYRGMDIGTAKPSEHARREVRYVGLDLVDPDRDFSVWDFRHAILTGLAGAPEGAIVAGGTGLYIKSLTHGLEARRGAEPDLRARWEAVYAERGIEPLLAALETADPAGLQCLKDRRNPRRVIRALERAASRERPDAGGAAWAEKVRAPLVGLTMAPEALRDRIRVRIDRMFAEGLLDEVRSILARYTELSRTAAQAIGYAEAAAVVRGELSCDAARASMERRTWRLVRRQRTWFRHQAEVHWIETAPGEPVEGIAERVRAAWRRLGAVAIAGM